MIKIKALSIREPYASMFLNGKKTIETRTWKTNHRGKLLLCASKQPPSDISGMAFAVCNLVDCRPMTSEDEEKAKCDVYPTAWSWILEDVIPIKTFPVKGQLQLFEVDCTIEILEKGV